MDGGWGVRFDMRVPAFAPARASEYYRAAFDMIEYADRHGCETVSFMEHHGSDDGYVPDGLTMAAAAAVRTERARLGINALILPLHDPVRTAERTLLVDQMSDGRVEVTIGAGYRASEYAMYGVALSDRVRLMEEKLPVYTRALTGEEVTYRGATFRVTPGPVQRPRPRVVLGGTVPAAARRAARLADGFSPRGADAVRLVEIYEQECARLGREPAVASAGVPGPLTAFVSADRERTWQHIAPYLIHESNTYTRWMTDSGTGVHTFRELHDVAELRAQPTYAVWTPEECAAFFRAGGRPQLNPLTGGIPPELGWESLRCLVEEALPLV